MIYTNPKSKFHGQIVEVTYAPIYKRYNRWDYHTQTYEVTEVQDLVVVKFKKGCARWVHNSRLEHFLT